MAEKYGKSTAQIILRWQYTGGNYCFPKSANPQHLRENIDIFDFVLTQDEISPSVSWIAVFVILQ
ncbi:MAG: aldo/keto reductase [[Clostridium] innocuum]